MKKMAALALAGLVTMGAPALADISSVREELKECDTNNDGTISREEFVKAKQEKFAKADANNDGKLDSGEQDKLAQKMASKMSGSHSGSKSQARTGTTGTTGSGSRDTTTH